MAPPDDDESGKPPRITVVKWTTPDSAESRKPFEGVCPWCASKAEHGAPGISVGRTCPGCGAIAWGASAADFDEVVDDALNHFRIDPAIAGDQRYVIGATWWSKAGVEVAVGGVGGEHAPMGLVFWYWFRRKPALH